ncbi:MAG: hypothetical protein AB1938_07050 [Myxococcota bacterium]
MRTLLPLFLVATLSLLTGCQTTHAVNPRDLVDLDGFDAEGAARDAERALETSSGEHVTFTADTPLVLSPSGDPWGQTYQRIRVDDLRFVGTTSSGREVSLALRDISEASVELRSAWKTALGIAIPLLLVGGVVGCTVALNVAFAH